MTCIANPAQSSDTLWKLAHFQKRSLLPLIRHFLSGYEGKDAEILTQNQGHYVAAALYASVVKTNNGPAVDQYIPRRM